MVEQDESQAAQGEFEVGLDGSGVAPDEWAAQRDGFQAGRGEMAGWQVGQGG